MDQAARDHDHVELAAVNGTDQQATDPARTVFDTFGARPEGQYEVGHMSVSPTGHVAVAYPDPTAVAFDFVFRGVPSFAPEIMRRVKLSDAMKAKKLKEALQQLAEEVGVPYHLGEAASEREVEYDYEPLSDGDVVEVGDVEIEALHTPGHTSEMMSYLVDGELLLTGDTLFVDSVGRTELQFGDEGAAALAAHHDVLGRQLVQGLAHGALTDLQLGRQARLAGQDLARLPRAGGDALAHEIADLLVQGAEARLVGQGGHGAGISGTAVADVADSCVLYKISGCLTAPFRHS